MNRHDRLVLHQLHPLKLATDILVTVPSTRLIWQHRFILGALSAFVPAILVSLLLLETSAFELRLNRLAATRWGAAGLLGMTGTMQCLRLVGLTVVWWGAWQHHWLILVAGLAIVLGGWLPTFRAYRGALVRAN